MYSLSHHFRGFIHPRWLFGISSIFPVVPTNQPSNETALLAVVDFLNRDETRPGARDHTIFQSLWFLGARLKGCPGDVESALWKVDYLATLPFFKDLVRW